MPNTPHRMNDGYYDPNSHIDPETLYKACQNSLFAFARARVAAHEVETGAPNSFMLGKVGNRRYLVYVRVTFEGEYEDDTGPIPGILIDKARELKAEPRVFRVHLRCDRTGTSIQYFGHHELTKEFKRGEPWRRVLLRGRTARQYLKLVGGRLSKLEVRVKHEPPGPWPKRIFGESADEKMLMEIFGEGSDEDHETPFPGSVTLALSVDTLGRQLEGYPISISHLVQSANENDEHEILTCTCGYGGCSGIWRGIETVHEDGLVVWRVRGVAPRRVVVFEREQYRQEILSKVRTALALHKELGEKAALGAGDRREFVERALYLAEENQE